MLNMIYERVYIVSTNGQMVMATYDFKKGTIQSHTLGGVKCLRKWGWDIQKINTKRKWHPNTPDVK
jgi:hypothetical protein